MRRPTLPVATRPFLGAVFAVVAATLAATASAQTLYRVTAPDGSVTFTDRPPASATRVEPIGRGTNAPAPALPPALRDAATRFPVVLYTIPDCAPCDRGRELLRARGIPYEERVADSDADREAWLRIVGSVEAPGLGVGRQMLRGFSATEWSSTLDLAGYPRESRLPPNHPPAAVTPLVARRSIEPPPAAVETPVTPLPVPTIPLPGGGIRF